jgi:hypothetical protein
MAKYLILIGILLVGLGLLWPWVSKFPLGRLPGDIVIERENFRLYLPLMSCLLVSLLVSLLLWFFRK